MPTLVRQQMSPQTLDEVTDKVARYHKMAPRLTTGARGTRACGVEIFHENGVRRVSYFISGRKIERNKVTKSLQWQITANHLATDPEVPGSIFGVAGLERGPLSLVRIIEELLE
jgi:hypothetical protein